MKTILVPLTVGVSFLASCGMMPVLLSLSHRFHWYDDTNHRKIHTGNVPRIGGVAIFISFLLGFLAWVLYASASGTDFSYARHLLPVLLGAALIHITGLYDDFRNIRALYKILLQIFAACLVVFTGHTVPTLYIPFFDTVLSLGPAGYFLSIVWIVGISNAINLIDGLDGLSSTVSASVLAGMGGLFLFQGSLLSAALAFSLLGGILGFFLFNKPPAKLFMGDSGSLSIGFLLACFPLVESTKTNPMTFLLSITLLLIPILDTFAAITRRLRRHIPVHSADKEHLHHKLMELGLPVQRILLVVFLFSAFLVGVVLLWLFSPGTVSAAVLVAAWLFMVFAFFALHVRVGKKRKAKE